MEPSDYSADHEHNRRAWNARVQRGERFTRPAEDKDFEDPLATVDGLGWLGGDIRGKQLLCLAAGGGRQSVLYAAAGANVTVVDISSAMLELDRRVAAERGFQVRTVEASMDQLTAFNTAEFDIVVQPVSSCYIPNIEIVYQQIARVMQIGGIYISQHKQPASLQADTKMSQHGYELTEAYYRKNPLPNVKGSRHREDGTLEYLHRWEELVGHLCRNGFVLEDLVEPLHADPAAEPGSFDHRSCYVPPYVRFKARRITSTGQNESDTKQIVVP